MQVLDVGCGPGSITISIAQQIPTGHVTGVEYVSDPLDGARELAKANGVSNVTFQEGDIHALPFQDNTFDVVHAHQVLQHIADPIQALREMRRVVKEGGIVACRESAELSWYPENPGIAIWRQITETMQRAKGGSPHPGRMIHVWARDAGFEHSKIKKSAGAWCFGSDEERAYWGGSMQARAMSSGFAKSAVGEGFAQKDDLEIIAAGWKDFVENQNAWFGLLHGEILCWK
jgi:ubiquinone/menaquinone biosynthesis C-methylase UbiE